MCVYCGFMVLFSVFYVTLMSKKLFYMILDNPFKRIHRCKRLPFFYDGRTDDYVLDSDYISSPERHSIVRSLSMLIKDLQTVLDFIEPDDENLTVYSHRLYELFLRASTEFESNCKGILLANAYHKARGKMTIQDYRMLNEIMKLSDYQVQLNFWNSNKSISPLSEWAVGDIITWYKSYNSVKHNRYENFNLANLNNVIYAIASVVCIVYAQLGDYMLPNRLESVCDNDGRKHCVYMGFGIISPSFEEDEYNIMHKEKYDVRQYFK